MTPMRISDLITSAPRSAMRLASSWTVIVSGTTTSRTILVCSCCACRWRSRSRARRTEARQRIRSPSSSSSARVTVSLPVRRRWSSSRRTGVDRPLEIAGAGRARRRGRFLFFLGRNRDLAGGRQRRDLGGGGLAGPLGDLAARFLLLAACASSSRSASRRPLRRGGAPLLLPPAGAPLPRPARAPRWRRALLPGAADRPRRARRGGAIPRRPCAHPAATRTRVACSSAVSVRATPSGRRAGSAASGAASGVAGWARATVGAAGSGRPPSGAAPGREDALLADLDGHRLRAAMREALAHLAGLDRSAQAKLPAERSVKGRFCSCSLASCSFASVMRFGTTILCRRPGRREIRCLARASRRAENRRAAPASSNSRRHSVPPPTATCTIRSRPNAAPSSSAVNTVADGRSRPSAPSLRRPLSAPSSAEQQQRGLAARTASPTRSNPATASPARRARPERVARSAAPAGLRRGRQVPAAP